MNIKILLCFIALAGAPDVTLANDPPMRSVEVAGAVNAPDLRLRFEIPARWQTEIYKEPGRSIARIFNPTSQGKEALVIASSEVPNELAGKGEGEVFDDRFLRDVGSMFSASVGKRVHDETFDGAYFEFTKSSAGDGNAEKTDVKNWIFLANGYIVQFQCYYPVDETMARDKAAAEEARLSKLYLSIIKTIRKG